MQQKEIHAKKSLGQHFLHDPGVVRRIVHSLQLGPGDVLLEIGCGTGALTRQLIGKPRQYVGVELDASLFESLRSLASSRVVFLNQDILRLNLLILREQFLGPGDKLKIVGNLPFYISSPILQYLAQQALLFDRAVIMLQAEVADRLVAQPCTKEYGVLTLLVQYHFATHELFAVSPRAFRPVPKVSSKVIELVPHPTRRLLPEEEREFFRFVKRAFSQRRKTMKNALKGQIEWQLELLDELLPTLRYPGDARAEIVSLEDYVTIYRKLRHKE